MTRPHRRGDDEGQLIILIVGFAVTAALLVTVVANVSKVFLYERSLGAAADGAAIAAAGAIDEAALYQGAVAADGRLPLDQEKAEHTVGEYAAAVDLPGRFDDFGFDVLVDGAQATVVFRARVSLPFLNLVSADYDHYPIEVAASAESPVRPAP